MLGKVIASLSLVAVIAAFQPSAAAAAKVVATVNLSSQTMTVTHGGVVKYRWPVSTARKGKVTPTGSWTAKWLSRNHRSSRYNNAPMPYSIFYTGNYAVHGTNQVSRLGRPASAGCIRLHPSNAAVLFSMAQREGLRNMKIVVRR
jgi:lipoprotein-anchoring transpeptidase ErfK/SrfK